MNSKKAKRLRQLVRHLQEKGGVADQPWVVDATVKKPVKMPIGIDGEPGVGTSEFAQRFIDPACGKAIYKQFKKNASLHGKPNA